MRGGKTGQNGPHFTAVALTDPGAESKARHSECAMNRGVRFAAVIMLQSN